MSWSFFKVCQAILIRNKEAINIGSTLEQIFINWYTSYFKSDNGRESINQTLKTYIEHIEVEYILR